MAHSSCLIPLNILDSRNDEILLSWHCARLRLSNWAMLMLTHKPSIQHIFNKIVSEWVSEWVRVEPKPQYNNFLDSIYLDRMEIIFENITRLVHLRIYLFILLSLVDWSLINFHPLKSDKIENVSLTYLTP